MPESRWPRPLVRWSLWSAVMVVWTILLVIPVPDTDGLIGDISVGRRYLIAKSVHVLAYAGLIILSAWLHAPPRFRWILVFVIMAHGTVTELIQREVGRTGTLDDVGFDNLGVFLGLLLTWKWWTSAATESA